MDINLTGPIAAQIVANLAQPSWDTTMTAILTVAGALLGAAIGVVGTLKAAEKTGRLTIDLEKWRLKTNEYQKKKDTFIKLAGKKPSMNQRYITLGESKILHEYYAKILRIPALLERKGEFSPEDVYNSELSRWEKIEDDVKEKIVLDNKDLQEISVFIQAYYPIIPDDLINGPQNAYETLNQKIETIVNEIGNVDPGHLNDLKEAVNKGKENWAKLVKDEFYTKIENLILGVKAEMAKEKDPPL